MIRTLIGAAMLFALMGCSPDAATPSNGASTTADKSAVKGDSPVTNSQDTPYTPPTIQGVKDPVDGEMVAVIDTNLGQIVVQMLPTKAPKHVKAFEELAGKKFFDGTKFHRVIPGFMIQGGDPNTKKDNHSGYGLGGPGFTVAGEPNDVNHVRGILSAARSQDRNSAGSQFFIVVKDSAFLNPSGPGTGYDPYGRVLSGMDIADRIVNLPRDEHDCPLDANPAIVKSISMVKWPIVKK